MPQRRLNQFQICRRGPHYQCSLAVIEKCALGRSQIHADALEKTPDGGLDCFYGIGAGDAEDAALRGWRDLTPWNAHLGCALTSLPPPCPAVTAARGDPDVGERHGHNTLQSLLEGVRIDPED